MQKRNTRKKAKLTVHNVETVFEEVEVNAAVPKRLNEGYARIAREILQVVATMMTNTPQYMQTVCLRKGISVRDSRAAFELLKRYNGNIDKIINEFLLANVKTIDSLRTILSPVREKNQLKYKRTLGEITKQLFKHIESWRYDAERRSVVSDDMQKLMIQVSRYVNPIPDMPHTLFMRYSRCCGCGKECDKEPHDLREIDHSTYPLLVPLCSSCYDAPDGIDYSILAEHYYALSQNLTRLINDITGRTWAGFDKNKKNKAQRETANADTDVSA